MSFRLSRVIFDECPDESEDEEQAFDEVGQVEHFEPLLGIDEDVGEVEQGQEDRVESLQEGASQQQCDDDVADQSNFGMIATFRNVEVFEQKWDPPLNPKNRSNQIKTILPTIYPVTPRKHRTVGYLSSHRTANQQD